MSGIEGIVLGLPPALVYAAATGMSLAESAAFAGLLLPGETVLFLSGVMAGLHVVSLVPLALLAMAGAVVGDAIGYAVGRGWGPALRSTRLGRRIGEQTWLRVMDAVRRRGVGAVVVGRWVGIVRALVPMTAGMSGLGFGRFMLANAAGAVVWVGVVLTLGYLTAASWAGALTVLTWLGPAVLGTVGGVLAVRALLRRRRDRRAAREPSPVADRPVTA